MFDNPIDLIIMIVVGVGSFFWSVRAGGPTEELPEILEAEEEYEHAPRSGADAAGS